MAEERVVVMDKQGNKFTVPFKQLPKAISRGYVPSQETAPVNKDVIQPVRGDTSSLVRESALGAASMALPAGEQFGQASLRDLGNVITQPIQSAKEIGKGALEGVAGLVRTADEAINRPHALMAQLSGPIGEELARVKAMQGTPEGDEYRANITGKMSGIAAQVFGAKALTNTKIPSMAEISRGAFPSFGRAAKNFEDVMAVAQRVPIDTTDLSAAASHARQLARSGGAEPKVIRDFIRRLNDPDLPPMTYEEARNFYSNASRLSADEANRLTPVMKREVSEFTKKLRTATEKAAENVGKSGQFNAAMEEYALASGRKRSKEAIKDLAVKALKAGVVGAGIGAGMEVYGALTK